MCGKMEPWLSQLLNELNESSKMHLLQLSTIIRQAGMDEETRTEWKSIIMKQIQDTYCGLLGDAKVYQNKLIDSIEELLKESEALCRQLHIKMPSYGSECSDLLQEKDLLKRKVKEYQDMVKVRKCELENLKKRQLNACRSLGQEPIIISESPLPTKDEIANFSNYIEKLEDERSKRKSKFIEVKCKILDLVLELEITPSLEIEKTVCSSDDTLFQVTDFNMKWIDGYYESLVQQKNQTINDITNLREKLSTLWEILSEDVQTRNKFLNKYKGHTLITLHALQTEVKRCEDLKKANIEKFIVKMRTKLISLWEKCHFEAIDRESFKYFHHNLYTEDLLAFHDIEVEKMKKYYENNKDVLRLIETREKYWKKRLELEEKERDPNRYKNRCASLLKDQKQHSKIVKKLIEMDQELFILGKKYETEHGKPFLSWGRTIADITKKTYEDYEADKKKQLSAKKQQRDLAVTPTKSTLFSGSTLSGSRKSLRTLTPSDGRTPQKRKMPPTNLFSSSKKTIPLIVVCDYTETSTKSATATHTKRARHSIERKKRLDKIRRLTTMLEKRKANNEKPSKYHQFEKEISTKPSCRSTLIDADSSSNANLAKLLPQTPKSARATPPGKRQLRTRTPIFTKLRTVPGSEMNI